MTFSKKLRFFAFLAVLFYTFSTAVYAETLTGKIESIHALKGGQSEVVLSTGKERSTITLNSKTSVESVVPASQLKKGALIYLSLQKGGGGTGSTGGGGQKGLKDPFRGIPKNMKKNMGLPDMPKTPDIPGQPEAAQNIPKAPKIPKVPKAPKAPTKQKEAPAEEGQANARKPVQPPVQEATEEEKTLFGNLSADKSLSQSTGEPLAPMPTARKVLSVKVTKQGVAVELEGVGGKKETVTLPPDKSVLQAFSAAGLRKNMQIKAETDPSKVAQKVLVVS